MSPPNRPPRPGTVVVPEDDVVRRLGTALARASGPPPPGETWVGDDAAVLTAPPGALLVATDAAVAGVHADLALVGLDDLGWKAVTATVSDIAAMGGVPWRALVTLCGPTDTDLDLLNAGVAAASATWRCPVVGGDLSGADDVVVVVAVWGSVEPDGPAPVGRGGAHPGDHLFVTGPLGASAAGLALLQAGADLDPASVGAALLRAHRRPQARVAEGTVARRAGATAMIDISDGFSLDLHRLAAASGVGVELDSVPVADGATEDEALAGGEDYELVLAAPDEPGLVAAFADAGLRPPIHLGRCTAEPTACLLRGAPLERRGYEHHFE